MLKVGRENSRFRALMAAQLNAASGESLYLGPKRIDHQDGKEDETSKAEHRPRTGLEAVDSSPLTTLWFTSMYVGIYGSHCYPFSRSYQRNAITLTILLLCFPRSLASLDFISPARFRWIPSSRNL